MIGFSLESSMNLRVNDRCNSLPSAHGLSILGINSPPEKLDSMPKWHIGVPCTIRNHAHSPDTTLPTIRCDDQDSILGRLDTLINQRIPEVLNSVWVGYYSLCTVNLGSIGKCCAYRGTLFLVGRGARTAHERSSCCPLCGTTTTSDVPRTYSPCRASTRM